MSLMGAGEERMGKTKTLTHKMSFIMQNFIDCGKRGKAGEIGRQSGGEKLLGLHGNLRCGLTLKLTERRQAPKSRGHF